jgi:hypothetical protein
MWPSLASYKSAVAGVGWQGPPGMYSTTHGCSHKHSKQGQEQGFTELTPSRPPPPVLSPTPADCPCWGLPARMTLVRVVVAAERLGTRHLPLLWSDPAIACQPRGLPACRCNHCTGRLTTELTCRAAAAHTRGCVMTTDAFEAMRVSPDAWLQEMHMQVTQVRWEHTVSIRAPEFQAGTMNNARAGPRQQIDSAIGSISCFPLYSGCFTGLPDLQACGCHLH